MADPSVRLRSNPVRPHRPHTFISRSMALARARFDRRRAAAVVLVLIIAISTAKTVERSRAIQASLGQTQPVLVATRSLPVGHVIVADDLTVRQRPVGQLPPGSLDDPALAVGATVRSSIVEDEPLAAHRLANNRLGLELNERAVTLALPFAPPPLEKGDIVDLIGVGADSFDGPVKVASTPLGQARVLLVSDDGITVAIDSDLVRPLLEHLGSGTVEAVITPLG